MRIHTALATALIAAGSMLQVPAFAESEPRAQLHLVVVDETNAALPAAAVTIYTTDGTPGIDVIADDKGVVVVPSLPVGFAQIYARFPDHRSSAEAATLERGRNVLTVTLPSKKAPRRDESAHISGS